MPAGRPSEFNEAEANLIAEMLCEKNLTQICKSGKVSRSRSTIERWIEERADFAEQCARAEKIRGELWFTKVLETAEDCTEETAHSSKVKISAYQWLASKENAKYGDKQIHTGPDGEGPVEFVVKSILDRE